jgi:two-component system, cell cycle response regulator
MPPSAQTTLIQRILDKRAEKLPGADDGTTATVRVMLRMLPPPKTLLVFEDSRLRQHTERRIAPGVLNLDSVANEEEALRRFGLEFCPLVLTDSPELIRKLRARQATRAPFILYVTDIDDPVERQTGLIAGADDCVERRVTDEEFNARLSGARRIAELEAVLRITMTENRKLSATDELTRVASRRFFGKHFPREVSRAARYGRPLSVVLCDIDHFKKLNETLGHPGGDQILRQFGSRLQQSLRAGLDWVARIGGEEFAIVLPETPYEGGLVATRKLRDGVSHSSFKADSKKVRVTASFGLCGVDRVPAGASRWAHRMLKTADLALYQSKHNGRNRITATDLKLNPNTPTPDRRIADGPPM